MLLKLNGLLIPQSRDAAVSSRQFHFIYLKTDNAAAGNSGQKTANNMYPVKNKHRRTEVIIYAHFPVESDKRLLSLPTDTSKGCAEDAVWDSTGFRDTTSPKILHYIATTKVSVISVQLSKF
jgi:hypothetical protein